MTIPFDPEKVKIGLGTSALAGIAQRINNPDSSWSSYALPMLMALMAGYHAAPTIMGTPSESPEEEKERRRGEAVDIRLKGLSSKVDKQILENYINDYGEEPATEEELRQMAFEKNVDTFRNDVYAPKTGFLNNLIRYKDILQGEASILGKRLNNVVMPTDWDRTYSIGLNDYYLPTIQTNNGVPFTEDAQQEYRDAYNNVETNKANLQKYIDYDSAIGGDTKKLHDLLYAKDPVYTKAYREEETKEKSTSGYKKKDLTELAKKQLKEQASAKTDEEKTKLEDQISKAKKYRSDFRAYEGEK